MTAMWAFMIYNIIWALGVGMLAFLTTYTLGTLVMRLFKK